VFQIDHATITTTYLSPDKRLIERKIEQFQIYLQSHFHFVKERDTEVSVFVRKQKVTS